MGDRPYGDRAMLIDGELVSNADNWITSLNPSTEDELGRVPAASAEDVARAAEAAARAQREWGAMTSRERGERLKALANAIRKRKDEIIALEAADSGNTIANLGNDLFKSSNHYDYFSGLANEIKGDTISGLSSGLHLTERRPFGVVGRIVPFNHPFMFAAANMAAPLVAGNSVILKTPETSPLSATILAELCQEILPAGVVNILSGFGFPAGDAIARHPLIKRIGFTGSVSTGLAIQRAAAETCVKVVTLELGGKNGLIIFPDADVEKAVDAAIAGMNFAWAGQSCGSTSRILAHSSVYATVCTLVREKLAAIRLGDAGDVESQMGPVNSAAQLERINRLISIGKQEANLLIGGDRPAGAEFKRGYWIAPTAFAAVSPESAIAREEVFGPVMTILKWDTVEQAIRISNNTEYGLTAALFGSDINTLIRTARRIDAGVININGSKMHYVGAPFGGLKNSGIGEEESLSELLSYTQSTTVHITL